VPLPVTYKSLQLDCGYRIDFLVEKTVVLELKAGRGNTTDSRSSTTDLSETGRMADRVAYQFQRASAQEGHQANSAQFEVASANSVSLR
jgi:PD-(D/E)XK nuclease superfamily